MTDKWMDDALCIDVDPELFFPERGESATRAKRVCEGCPVIQQCLKYALDNNITDGVWGGRSSNERRDLVVSVKVSSGATRLARRVEQVEQFFSAGVSVNDISSNLGVSLPALERWANRNGFFHWARMFRETA